MATLIELATKLRPLIEKAIVVLDDEDAVEATTLFATWRAGTPYVVGDRVKYDNILYKCLQPHTSQDSWTPTAAPSLWAKVLIPDASVIPEWEQPDSTNAYQIGDKVMFEGKTYECVIANNIWSPRDYPNGWREL